MDLPDLLYYNRYPPVLQPRTYSVVDHCVDGSSRTGTWLVERGTNMLAEVEDCMSQAGIRTVKTRSSSNKAILGSCVEKSGDRRHREEFGASMAWMAQRSKYITANNASTRLGKQDAW
jgi:hypothetical protein